MSLNSIHYCDPGNAEEDKTEHPVQKEHAVNCPNPGQRTESTEVHKWTFQKELQKSLLLDHDSIHSSENHV